LTALRAGERLRVVCGQMVHGGLCVAHPDESTTVLVDGAIPGETVEVELRFRKKRTWFANVASVIDASPHRLGAPCQYVPDCGGCQLQHVEYTHQLEMKRAILLDALQRQSVAAPQSIELTGMEDPWRYRRRGEFHVVPGQQGVTDAGLGFNRARSWRPIAVDDCLIHHRAITDSLPLLQSIVRTGGTGELRVLHVTVGDPGGELLIRGKPRRALSDAAIDDAVVRGESALRLATDSTSLTWRGHSYRVTPEAFIQVNWQQMEALYAAVIRGLADYAGKRIIDAYAGIGVLAVDLAARAQSVVCIESSRAAARMGVLNARLNDAADKVTYVPEPVEEALPRLAVDAEQDLLILDPPRAGCDSRVTAWLALAGPERVVYVSCDPATLARDLHVLVASGPYRIASLEIVDMFPQTYHVESVTTLVRTRPTA
jgi:23S rRNA (uracil1939-C5)-methyltransferase